MSLKNTFEILKKPGITCGLVFGLLLSGQAMAECELEAGYELPKGVKFDKYCSFTEGLAPVVKSGKYGFVN